MDEWQPRGSVAMQHMHQSISMNTVLTRRLRSAAQASRNASVHEIVGIGIAVSKVFCAVIHGHFIFLQQQHNGILFTHGRCLAYAYGNYLFSHSKELTTNRTIK